MTNMWCAQPLWAVSTMFHLSRSLSASLHQRAPDDQEQQSDRREARNNLASKSPYKRVDAPKKREAKKNRPHLL